MSPTLYWTANLEERHNNLSSNNEQFRRLDELTDLAEKMSESIKMALLQNVVKDIPQLSIVETLDEYTSTTSGAGSTTQLTYTSYYNLLIIACIIYDATNTSTPLTEDCNFCWVSHPLEVKMRQR